MCEKDEDSQLLTSSGRDADAKKDKNVTSGISDCFGHWIEITLLDEDRNPISKTKCVIISSDGATHGDYTNKAGKARFEKIAKGKAQITFPDLDKSSLQELLEIETI
jgi:hypothetical protein